MREWIRADRICCVCRSPRPPLPVNRRYYIMQIQWCKASHGCTLHFTLHSARATIHVLVHISTRHPDASGSAAECVRACCHQSRALGNGLHYLSRKISLQCERISRKLYWYNKQMRDYYAPLLVAHSFNLYMIWPSRHVALSTSDLMPRFPPFSLWNNAMVV